MNYLLDTNVVSEWTKPAPDAGVVGWLEQADEDRIFLSVVTLTELRYGIERLPLSKRRKALEDWIDNELLLRFESRILMIDPTIADACGKLVAQSEAIGRPLEVVDAFLAATAQVNQLTLVTRNVDHFQPFLRIIVNPWTRP